VKEDDILRIEHHPILEFPERKRIGFTMDSRQLWGREGDTIASALHDNGILKLSESSEKHRPRGLYCAIGNCSSCHMIVDGVPTSKPASRRFGKA
jgi:ferredoxin